jgi:DNA polymerase III alpha subunit (gram-positive type)
MIATVFDTETTGLIDNPARKLEKQPEIISFAAQTINLATGEYLPYTYNLLFKPTNPISSEITKITGISNDDVKDCQIIYHYINDIIPILEEAPLLIGQNIRFDMDMIELECKRWSRTIKWPKTLDLIQHTIHLKGYRLSLTNLHLELFGMEFAGAHQANVDVAITCKCAIELYKRGLL